MKLRRRRAPVPDTRLAGNMTIIEHLNELRSRLLRAVLAIFVGMIVGFVVYDHVLNFLQGPYEDLCHRKFDKLNCDLVNLDPLGGFGTRMRLSGYMGLALAMPVVLWQVWRFIAPGLLAKEKKYAIPFVVSSMVLFASGAFVAWITLPKALEWLTAYAGSGTQPQFVIDKYVGFVVLLMVGFGIGFQFPVILVTVQLLGLVQPGQLLRQWRLAIVIIAVIAAVVTPGGDPFSMIGLGGPMIVFYFVSAGIGHVVLTRRRRRAAAENS
jgi:sec-independent protein translocase protein TatC